MKRFFASVLGVSLFFVCLGAVVDKVGAKFKSDEKALDIIKKARTAIGGDAAIAEVRGLVIKGQTSKTISINGAESLEQGETEIVFQYPDKMYKMIKIGDHDGAEGNTLIEKKVDVIVVGGEGEKHNNVILEGKDGEFTTDDGKKIRIRKTDGGEFTTADGEAKAFVRKKSDGGEWKTEDDDVKEIATPDGKTVTVVRKGGEGNATFTTESGKHLVMERKAGFQRDNELLRTTLSLLLSAPEGMDVSYTFAGESSLDGTAVNAVVAAFGGSSYKLYFDRSSNLPVGLSYVGHPSPVIVKFRKEGGDPAAEKDVATFNRKIDRSAAKVEHFVRFSDYRNTNGVQLPYKWTTTVGGKQSEVFDVSSYEVNPANIADRFKGERVFVRRAKPAQN